MFLVKVIAVFLLVFILQARHQILEIHTREWNPKLADCFLKELARKTAGKDVSVAKCCFDLVYQKHSSLISVKCLA